MMAVGNVRSVIQGLNRRIGGRGAALLARNGGVLFADLPAELHTETWAIMCATVLGAATVAGTELGGASPGRIIVEGGDSITVIVGSGEAQPLVAIVERGADLGPALDEVGRVAQLVATN